MKKYLTVLGLFVCMTTLSATSTFAAEDGTHESTISSTIETTEDSTMESTDDSTISSETEESTDGSSSTESSTDESTQESTEDSEVPPFKSGNTIDQEHEVSLTINQETNDSVQTYKLKQLLPSDEIPFNEKDNSSFKIGNTISVKMGNNHVQKVENLEQGYYRVTPLDEKGEALQEPYVLTLPYLENDKVVYDVTIYPKPIEKQPQGELLQTSVEKTNAPKALLATLGAVFLVGIGLIWKKVKGHEKNN